MQEAPNQTVQARPSLITAIRQNTYFRRTINTIPEITISIATLASIIILFAKDISKVTEDEKMKMIKQMREIGVVMMTMAALYVGWKVIRGSLGRYEVSVLAQMIPFLVTILIAQETKVETTDGTQTDQQTDQQTEGAEKEDTANDKALHSLRIAVFVSIFLQSILRLNTFACTVV
jgi:undecaprenyl pyrophosphate phosphatase UppP